MVCNPEQVAAVFNQTIDAFEEEELQIAALKIVCREGGIERQIGRLILFGWR